MLYDKRRLCARYVCGLWPQRTSDPAPRLPPIALTFARTPSIFNLRGPNNRPRGVARTAVAPNRPHRAPPQTAREWGVPHSWAHGYISCLERRQGTFSALGSTPATDPPRLWRSQVFLDRAHPAFETDFAPQDSVAPEPSLTGLSRPPTPLPPRLGCPRAFLRPGAPGRSRQRYLRDSGAPKPSLDWALPAVLVTVLSTTRALPSLPSSGRSRISLSRRPCSILQPRRQITLLPRRLATAKPVRPIRPERPTL
ncbi:hypothetical protein PUN28_019724 [Cardiocondyla obscurior]|uniref:Uncharacterized protein n=1 Tax=Cardiocondyla obscurior TaxID=286306 RepID=A0AAW2EA65_9HYME